ncbi:MAG: amidohydrolase family protein [Stellaceae bacterium]
MTSAIDIWCNIFTPAGLKKYYADVEEMAVIFQGKFAGHLQGYSPQDFSRVLDAAGIDKIIIPNGKHRSFMLQELHWNMSVEEVAEIVRVDPARYVGIYGINPFTRMEGVRELETAVKEHGFKGAHVHAYGFGLPVNHAMFYPFYAKCAELGVPVEIQVGHAANLMPSAMGQPILLDDIALYFPELKVIGLHTGWPWVEELISLAVKHKNLFIGATGHGPRYWDASLIRYLNSRGQDKVLFGTDFPLLLHQEALRQVDELDLRPGPKQKLLRDNALRVFGL